MSEAMTLEMLRNAIAKMCNTSGYAAGWVEAIDAHLAKTAQPVEAVEMTNEEVAAAICECEALDSKITTESLADVAFDAFRLGLAHPRPTACACGLECMDKGHGDCRYASPTGEQAGEVDVDDLHTSTVGVLNWLERLADGKELRPDADTHAFHPEPEKTKFRKASVSSAKVTAEAFVPVLKNSRPSCIRRMPSRALWACRTPSRTSTNAAPAGGKTVPWLTGPAGTTAGALPLAKFRSASPVATCSRPRWG